MRGLGKMVQEDRYGVDLLTWISGVTKALESLAFEVLDEHVRHCVSGAIQSGDAEAAAAKSEELLAPVQRFARAL